MKAAITQRSSRNILFGLVLTLTVNSFADQVLMQNGDRYNGKVLSVSSTNVVFQSDVLGTVTLSRSKVMNLTMGLVAATNVAPVSATSAKTNASADLSAALRQLGNQSNLVNQVRGQFLAAANPEANQKFNQMLGDLNSGKMSIADLRAQAKDAANQLRALEKEAGDDASGTVGLYLSILDSFLAETESPSLAPTNSAARKKP